MMLDRSSRLAALAPWLLSALVAALYLPVIVHGGFLWCDDYTFAQNRLMRDQAGLARIWSGGDTEQYYPITYSAYWLVARLFGSGAFAPHVLSVALHVVNGVLLWMVLRRLGLGAAAFGALLFALHPIQVESVAWIYELKNVLSTSLLLLTALLHLRYLRDGRALSLALTLATFTLALLAKSAVLVYPALALLLLRRHDRPHMLRSLVPLGLLSVAMAALTVWYERHQTGAQGGEWPQGLAERTAIAGQTFWFYLGKMLWPQPLSFAYPRFAIDVLRFAAFAPAVLAVLCVGTCLVVRRARGLAMLLLAYTILVFPVLGFFNIYMMRYTFVADHLAYLPSMLVLPAAAGALARVHRWLPVPVVVIMAALTAARTPLFERDQRLWQQALAVDDQAWLAHAGLARCLQESGDVEAAFPHYQRAIEIHPRALDVRHLLCVGARQRGPSRGGAAAVPPPARDRSARRARAAQPRQPDRLARALKLAINPSAGIPPSAAPPAHT
ncbi:MAG: glycosyltransferase family 39 protein [Planctomycetota bacterium]